MAHKKEYLKEMGIDIWQDKSRINDASMTAKTSSQNNLEDIKKQVASCKLCDLHKTRTNTVFGVGNEKAKVMFEKNMQDITHLICHDIFFIDHIVSKKQKQQQH